ncbi:MAG: N-formylglutamate amidohydrolase, partial [Pseudomonadota bacterium]
MKPFALAMPDRLRHPLMLASPHSGRTYPDCFLEQSRLNMATLRRSEDFCVDGLYDFAPSLNLPYMVAQFPRSFVDVNRSAEEIDPTLLFQEEAEQNIEISRRVANGLGVIPRVVGAGIEIYPDPVGLFETRQRLAQFHIPYHEALQHCLAQIHEQCGAVVLIDCHSMPDTVSTRRLSAGKSCDIVLGDRYGASCHRDVVEAAEACFKKLGYRVARNDPYAGGYITQRYGSPEKDL